jgi:aminomethyltransferase
VTTEGAHDKYFVVISQVQRTDGAQHDTVLRLFYAQKDTVMTLQTTPLNASHRAMGAKMVDFGGWDMPLHYGSQLEEHNQVRTDAGMFDVSHMRVVDLKGEGARPFLRYLLANNVDKLQSTGRALYSCMLNPEGGVIDDLIVYFSNETWFRLVVNAGTADKDIAWMQEQAATHAPKLEIKPRPDLAMIAIQGPQAAIKLWEAMPGLRNLAESLKPFTAVELGTMFVARTGYTGEDGFEIMLPTQAAPFFWEALSKAGVKPIGLGARDTLRLEAGMNLYGHDMDETINPLEAGLAWTVDLKSERDFIGKEALLANPATRKLVGLVLQDRGVMRDHQTVKSSHGDGEITSGSFSPTLNQSIALARLPNEVQIGDMVQISVRDKLLNAKVVKYPFVRNGKGLI